MPRSSCLLYGCSILAVLVALLVGIVVKLSQVPSDVRLHLLQESNSNNNGESFSSIQLLTDSQIEQYQTDGVVFVKQLLTQPQAQLVAEAGQAARDSNPAAWLLSLLFGSQRYASVAFDVWRTSPPLAQLVLKSLPRVAAQILPYSINPNNNNVEFRLLRDALFEYSSGGTGCGWHVDDAGFWPTLEDRDGPTVWIALDAMTVAQGGGLAVLNQTYFQELGGNLTECRHAIRTATCDMEQKRPECYQLMEAAKLQWNMEPGDAILWNRWTFHRGVAAATTNTTTTSTNKRRYSVRYMPHGSKATPSGNLHSSIASGATFDDSPYYPQVWPALRPEEVQAMERGLEADLTLSKILFFAVKVQWNKLQRQLFPKEA